MLGGVWQMIGYTSTAILQKLTVSGSKGLLSGFFNV